MTGCYVLIPCFGGAETEPFNRPGNLQKKQYVYAVGFFNFVFPRQDIRCQQCQSKNALQLGTHRNRQEDHHQNTIPEVGPHLNTFPWRGPILIPSHLWGRENKWRTADCRGVKKQPATHRDSKNGHPRRNSKISWTSGLPVKSGISGTSGISGKSWISWKFWISGNFRISRKSRIFRIFRIFGKPRISWKSWISKKISGFPGYPGNPGCPGHSEFLES